MTDERRGVNAELVYMIRTQHGEAHQACFRWRGILLVLVDGADAVSRSTLSPPLKMAHISSEHDASSALGEQGTLNRIDIAFITWLDDQ